jgi:hypothetical protein
MPPGQPSNIQTTTQGRKTERLIFSVSDPDPDWIQIQSGQWIRIRIQEGKNRKNYEIACFEVPDVLFGRFKASSVAWTSFMEA